MLLWRSQTCAFGQHSQSRRCRFRRRQRYLVVCFARVMRASMKLVLLGPFVKHMFARWFCDRRGLFSGCARARGQAVETPPPTKSLLADTCFIFGVVHLCAELFSKGFRMQRWCATDHAARNAQFARLHVSTYCASTPQKQPRRPPCRQGEDARAGIGILFHGRSSVCAATAAPHSHVATIS